MLERLNCLSPYGIEKIRGISPIGSAERLNRHFDNIEKIIFLVKESKSKFDEIANCLAHFKNIRGIIKKCQNGNGLNEIDLFEIKGFLLILEKFIPLFDELPIFAGIGFVSMIDALNILDPQNQRIAPFSVSNEFSAALKEIRREKTLIENMPKDDNFTAKRAEIVALEQAEEERVMRQLSEKLRKYCEDFYHNTDNIGELDLTIAKALQAMEYGAIRPEIGGNSLLLQDMYNPYVAEILAKVNKKFTEISLKLENGATVITGANMGGKS
ncbi:MAG: hypothetical protein FWD01_05695, partial [Defluviitaleaceae bacterium]|nr:hypothetical protein [Defluviitaleaceae bacterium]